MTSILIRCDASLSIGSGHVMRCRTLARELERRGERIIFICRRQAGDLISLLEQEFRVLALPEQQLSAYRGLESRELYKAWLGCSQTHDAVQSIKAIAQADIVDASWIVVDHYGLDTNWETQLLTSWVGHTSPRLFVIDDLADRSHHADLLLDQNFFAEETDDRYQGLLPPHCRQLLGPEYALLSPEYSQLHPLVPPRKELRRLLLFFGGVDPENFTGRTLEVLMDSGLTDLAVDVVLGLQSLHRQKVTDLVAQRAFTKLHSSPPSLAGLIARADLAIGGVGTTTWERACLGLPSISIAVAENQTLVSNVLAKSGYISLVTSIENSFKKEVVYNLSKYRSEIFLKHNSIENAKLCKGNGVYLITSLLTS